MASYNTKVTVSAPSEINVPLVRADYLDTSNIFRIFFEVFLAMTSSLVGVTLTQDNLTATHWAFLVVAGLATIVFCGIAIFHYKKAKAECDC